MAILGDNMVPLNPLPPSVHAYLDALDCLQPILGISLSDLRLANLYEIKRRFHSWSRLTVWCKVT